MDCVKVRPAARMADGALGKSLFEGGEQKHQKHSQHQAAPPKIGGRMPLLRFQGRQMRFQNGSRRDGKRSSGPRY